VLDEKIKTELRDLYNTLNNDGKLSTRVQVQGYLDTFKSRFGLDKLAGLDGELLLETMHGNSRDSLVYWLEFKNDDELPNIFGSIAGGSALKYGIYKSAGTGDWMLTNNQTLTLTEAIDIARQHRDQLILGCQILNNLLAGGKNEDYLALQTNLSAKVPISDTAWAHKYFSLIYPDKLDFYHTTDYQRYNLVKILIVPFQVDGRYSCAGQYVQIASELEITVKQLTTILSDRNGRPHRYWRIGTSDGTDRRNRWNIMRDGRFVAIGWPDVGDLSGLPNNAESLEKIRNLVTTHYQQSPATIGKAARQILKFTTDISIGALVVACDGATVLGIGMIKGDYYFAQEYDFPHQRQVDWLSLEEWRPAEPVGLQTTVYDISYYKNYSMEVEIERHILYRTDPVSAMSPVISVIKNLDSIPGQIQEILGRKGQVILYGPPGTGKTRWAVYTARQLAALSVYGYLFDELSPGQQDHLLGQNDAFPGNVKMCCFHPAYGYENFIEGYKPELLEGKPIFTLKPQIFKLICADAKKYPQYNFYLVIDEINRGDIPRIFGELITLLEKDKRGKSSLALPVSGEDFSIPANLFIIGTMNTADRSIALLDTALRRRFGFIELLPDYSVLGDAVVNGIPLGQWLESLNSRICTFIGRDARNLQIGHSYLLEGDRPISSFSQLSCVLKEDIIPLLQEYCYEDYSALEKILGQSLVDARNQRINLDLFDDNRQDDLLMAILGTTPSLSTTREAVVAESSSSEATISDEQNEDGGE
jgi:5-methylcytosine-specific restriction protein B